MQIHYEGKWEGDIPWNQDQYDNPMPESISSLQSGTMNLYTVCSLVGRGGEFKPKQTRMNRSALAIVVRSSGLSPSPTLTMYFISTEAEFLDEIQTKVSKVLRVFPPCYSQSPKLSLEISILSTSRNLLSISLNSRNLLHISTLIYCTL